MIIKYADGEKIEGTELDGPYSNSFQAVVQLDDGATAIVEHYRFGKHQLNVYPVRFPKGYTHFQRAGLLHVEKHTE